MERIDFVLASFKNIQELIRFIDQKSGAILVLSGILFTGYISFIKRLIFCQFDEISFINVLVFIASLSTVISLIVVIYISIFKVLKPRLAENYQPDEFSLFYFEHIHKLGKTKVLKEYELLDDEKMMKYIIDQQHQVSLILDKKTKALGISFNWLFYSLISFILFALFIKIL